MDRTDIREVLDLTHASPRGKGKNAPTEDYVIQTKGLVKTFGGLRAVDGLDLEIRRGQLYGLLGPNGCGKTTTIRMALGLLTITEGWVEVLGVRMPDKELMSRIGYMPQETAVYRELTVHDNLELFGHMYEVPLDKMDRRERELLKLVALTDWRDSMAGDLSGGMMHRLSLACAMMHNPEVMFLDEPTVGVDPELRDNLWHHFQDLCKQGKTIILTTHYIEESRHCDLVGLMRDGRIIVQDAPKSLMQRAGTETLEDAFLYFTKGMARSRRLEKGKTKQGRSKKDAGGEEE
jgi:ABC-2 type transport system ATP-binding protein